MQYLFLHGLVVAALVAAGAASAQSPNTSSTTSNSPASTSQAPQSFRPVEYTPIIENRPTSAEARLQPTIAPLALPPAPLGKDYRLGPNDLIEVEVFEMENLKRTVRINAAGLVSLPLIGSVQIAGLTPTEVEVRIAEKYSEKYLQNPQVSVFVKEFTSERITVEGAVARPGIFPLTGQLTLLRVIALAGGFGTIANPTEVMLFRVNDKNVREVAIFDVEKIRSGKAEDPVIKGDDMIVVQRDKTRALIKDSLLRDVIDSVNPFSALAR